MRPTDYVEFGTLASLAGMSVADFAELNPGFLPAVQKGKLRVPPNYVIRVPKGQAASFNQKYAALGPGNVYNSQKSYYVQHKVRSGQSLSVIARRYNTSVSSIMRTNNLRSAHRIRVGQVLKIPSEGGGGSVAPSAYAGNVASSTGGSYRIKQGDTLGAIAKRHGTSVSALMRANKLSNARALQIGQSLIIPGGSSVGQAQAVSSQAATHTVQSGDVLSKIAKRYGVSVSSLMQANNLSSAHKLSIGQRLKIPAGGSAASAAPSYVSHTVQQGQTLSAIARRYGTSVGSIQRTNNLRSAHSIRVGQVLRIPSI